jgi:hypothetical protein
MSAKREVVIQTVGTRMLRGPENAPDRAKGNTAARAVPPQQLYFL